MKQDPERIFNALATFLSLVVVFRGPACVLPRGKRYRNFTIKTPLGPDDHLILGFMGRREPWNNEKRGVRKLALKLRAMHRRGVYIETVENQRRRLSLELIQ